MNSRFKKSRLANEMYSWAKDLFPICRSITGPGVRATLNYIKDIVPGLNIFSVPTGTQLFDWEVPNEWSIQDAYIIGPDGNKFADFKKNNLHIVGYSVPVNKSVSLEDLQGHIFSIPDLPGAIPYVTSYYQKNWGFCITHNERTTLKRGKYQVFIDSSLMPGNLNYGEVVIGEEGKEEVLLSTYICHPSLANNELSGPIVMIALALWLQELGDTRCRYRIVFVPETIGSIAYIHANLNRLKEKTIGGFIITCVGDELNYSFLESKFENTLFDKIGRHVLKYHTENNYKHYSFLDRGSDERQYSSVGVDVPMISLMRSKYGTFKEYHTSLDNLDFISPEGLYGGFEIHRKAIYLLENNFKYKIATVCEPKLDKRGLYPFISNSETQKEVEQMMNIIAYADGKIDLVTLAEKIHSDALTCIPIIEKLNKVGLLTINYE